MENLFKVYLDDKSEVHVSKDSLDGEVIGLVEFYNEKNSDLLCEFINRNHEIKEYLGYLFKSKSSSNGEPGLRYNIFISDEKNIYGNRSVEISVEPTQKELKSNLPKHLLVLSSYDKNLAYDVVSLIEANPNLCNLIYILHSSIKDCASHKVIGILINEVTKALLRATPRYALYYDCIDKKKIILSRQIRLDLDGISFVDSIDTNRYKIMKSSSDIEDLLIDL